MFIKSSLSRKSPNATMATQPTSFTLPSDFLSKPSRSITKKVIDFTAVNLPEYHDCYATLIDGAFSASECQDLISAAEARTNGVWEAAMVNIGGGRQCAIPDVRDCGRIIWDEREIVGRIWDRVKDHVPEIHRMEKKPRVIRGFSLPREVWNATRLNERMRFLKYTDGQYFKPHEDGTYVTPDGTERSFYTLHLYLNESEELKGGATEFFSDRWTPEYKVEPKVGRVLIFQHRRLLHSGEDVEKGTKYTLRTDLMFKKEESEES